jgi:glycosyltransferase involved in cell wall biosynthesis
VVSSDPRAITVVIATYQRPEALATVLRSLACQTLDRARYEVVVVVDGIDDHEMEYRRVLRDAINQGLPITYDFQPNSGQATARHRAILQASGRWVCVVDDDMELLAHFLDEHLTALEDGGDRAVVIGRVIPEAGWESSPLYEAVRTKHVLEWHEALSRGDVDSWGIGLITQNVSFARDFYLSIGGFDPQLRLAEDSELGLRFEFADGRCVFSPEAAAIHRSRVGTYETWLRRCVEYGRLAVYIHDKHNDPRTHPLQALVYGNRLNAALVLSVCWSNHLARAAIVGLHQLGNALQRARLTGPAIATHKAIQAIAYHLGVKAAIGSWRAVIDRALEFRRSGNHTGGATARSRTTPARDRPVRSGG